MDIHYKKSLTLELFELIFPTQILLFHINTAILSSLSSVIIFQSYSYFYFKYVKMWFGENLLLSEDVIKFTFNGPVDTLLLLNSRDSCTCNLGFKVLQKKEKERKRETMMASSQQSVAQRSIQQDWSNREYIEVITCSVKKITDFLNTFDLSCRSRLATLNEKLTQLERKVEYIEARITKGETLS